jgi:hypothetical protein
MRDDDYCYAVDDFPTTGEKLQRVRDIVAMQREDWEVYGPTPLYKDVRDFMRAREREARELIRVLQRTDERAYTDALIAFESVWWLE